MNDRLRPTAVTAEAAGPKPSRGVHDGRRADVGYAPATMPAQVPLRRTGIPAVSGVEGAAKSHYQPSTETTCLPEKICADKHIAAFLRRAEIRFILPYPPSFPPEPLPSAKLARSHPRTPPPDCRKKERRLPASPLSSLSRVSLSAPVRIRPPRPSCSGMAASRPAPQRCLRHRRGTIRRPKRPPGC